MQGFGVDAAISTTFAKYDRDNSGFLDQSELANFFNGVFQMIKVPITVGQK